jgi:hypothetical protein
VERQQHSWEGAAIATSTGPFEMREAEYYALSVPGSKVITGCDSIPQLERNGQLAREYAPLSTNRMTPLAASAEPVSRPAVSFRFVNRR